MKGCVAIILAAVLSGQAVGAEATAVPIVGADLIVSPAAEDAPQAGRLRILERRRMGLTVPNIVRVLRDMKASGELADFVDESEDGVKSIDISNLAVVVAGKLAAEKPADWSDIDWESVLQFLERVLQLLIEYLPAIIELFLGLL